MSTFTQRVAEYFRAHPNQWIDAGVLQEIGGRFASRTRISDCRTELGMQIENRTRRLADRTVSEYRFLPAVDEAAQTQGHDLNAGFQLR